MSVGRMWAKGLLLAVVSSAALGSAEMSTAAPPKKPAKVAGDTRQTCWIVRSARSARWASLRAK